MRSSRFSVRTRSKRQTSSPAFVLSGFSRCVRSTKASKTSPEISEPLVDRLRSENDAAAKQDVLGRHFDDLAEDWDHWEVHVIPGMMRRFHEAVVAARREVVVWRVRPRRELLHVEDLARAFYRLMQIYEDPMLINVGVGDDHDR